MAQLIPIATWGLSVKPNEPAQPAFEMMEPATLQLSMAAIDPGEDTSKNEGIEEFKKPRATVKMLVIKELDNDDDDDDDDMGMDMDGFLGEDDSEDEEDNGEGPSDPSRSPKEMKKAAIRKALKEDESDVLANGATKGKGKAADDVDMVNGEDDDDLDDSDEEGSLPSTEEYVLCTLDPNSHFNQPLNLTIPLREAVAFRVEGTHSIHLTGNLVINPADSASFGSETSDSEDEDQDIDMPVDDDELSMPEDEDESDELDDMEDPRITELGSDEEDKKPVPGLIKATQETKKNESKGKNKRPAEDSLLEDKDAKPTTDGILDKALKKESPKPESVQVNGEQKLSKSQQKKLRKKMKDNTGNAVEVRQEVDGEDEGEKLTTEVKKEAPDGKTKSVQFAETLIKGPGVNGTGSTVDKNEKKEEKSEKGSKQQNPRTVQGVTIDDKKTGTGPQAKKGDKVSARYIGKLENKRQFDANKKGAPFTFKIGSNEVIKGMDIGFAGMQVGGERRITIPAHLGYGKKAQGDIPPNSTLIFDVKLLAIN